MQSESTTAWVGRWRPPRSRRRRVARHRPSGAFRLVTAILAKVTMGLLLVGCSTVSSLRLGNSQPKDPIATIQSDATGSDRVEAYRALEDPSAVPAELRAMARKTLVDGARHEYHVLSRAAAVSALASYQDADIADVLVEASRDRNPIVRVEAARALGHVEPSKSIEALKRLALEDEDADVRMAAAGALLVSSQPASAQVLLECLRDEELAVVRRAAEGLRSLTGASIDGSDYVEWNEWLQAHPDHKAVENIATNSEKPGLFDVFRR